MMFYTQIPVRIDDINYGNHLAHDKLVTLMHEARLQFFSSIHQSEIDFYGVGLILKSLKVNYQKEAFYQDILKFQLSISSFRETAFNLSYQIKNQNDKLIATAEVMLVGYDYQKKKVARFSTACKTMLAKYQE